MFTQRINIIPNRVHYISKGWETLGTQPQWKAMQDLLNDLQSNNNTMMVANKLDIIDLSQFNNQKVVKESLRLMMKDDMFFQSHKARIWEFWRSMLESIWWEKSNRTHELYNKKVKEALELTEKTGRIHTIIYDKIQWYVVFDRNTLQENAMRKPEDTNVTLFRQILSGDNYRDLLKNIFGEKGIEWIWLYIMSRGNSSRLIEWVSQDKIDYLLSFAEVARKKLNTISNITTSNLPETSKIIQKIWKNIEIKFDKNGDFDFMETFGWKWLNPTELNQITKNIHSDYQILLKNGQSGINTSINSLKSRWISGYSDIQEFYKWKKAKEIHLLKGFEDISIGTPLSLSQLSNIQNFFDANPELKNEDISKSLNILVKAQMQRDSAARVIPQTRVITQKTDNPKTEEAKKFANQIDQKNTNLSNRLKATWRIGEAREIQKQLWNSIQNNKNIESIIEKMDIGSYEEIISHHWKLAQAIAILQSKISTINSWKSPSLYPGANSTKKQRNHWGYCNYPKITPTRRNQRY